MDKIVDAITNLSFHDYYDWILLVTSIVIPILTAIINVHVVNKNTNKQIANQNRETYRPRLRLKHVQVASISNEKYLLYAYSKKYIETKKEVSKVFSINLENIGNGLANDISFYMLHAGEKCIGCQVNNASRSQILRSTIEIPSGCTEKVNILINFSGENTSPTKEDYNDDNFCLLICNYQDLNKNNYKILIGIILKEIKENNNYEEQRLPKYSITFDYYYYQEGTEIYDNMVNKDIYIKKYKKILSDIENSKKL